MKKINNIDGHHIIEQFDYGSVSLLVTYDINDVHYFSIFDHITSSHIILTSGSRWVVEAVFNDHKDKIPKAQTGIIGWWTLQDIEGRTHKIDFRMDYEISYKKVIEFDKDKVPWRD